MGAGEVCGSERVFLGKKEPLSENCQQVPCCFFQYYGPEASSLLPPG